MKEFWLNWWHVVAISVAMAHFSWIRYHYRFTFEPREEELIESDLFNEAEYQTSNLLVPYLKVVLDKSITKEGRDEITEPLYAMGESVFMRNEAVCIGLLALNSGLNRFVYEPLDQLVYSLMDISSPQATVPLTSYQLLLISSD